MFVEKACQRVFLGQLKDGKYVVDEKSHDDGAAEDHGILFFQIDRTFPYDLK